MQKDKNKKVHKANEILSFGGKTSTNPQQLFLKIRNKRLHLFINQITMNNFAFT